METKEQYLLEAKNLSKYFPVKNFFGKLVQEVRAVNRVNLSIKKGETFGLVGESGCGKSTLGRTLIRMYEPTDGILTYDGHDITKTKGKELLAYHKRMQIIFQDPYSALDPHQNVREIMAEPISVFEKLPEKEMDERIVSLLEKVGMKADDMEKYAYEFSGGQRQRIGIARALSVHPEFLLCDEPISALDVSIQAQVVNVLEDLQQELGLTYLFVAHDLSMVRHISDRIGVMYLGKIVESGESDEVYDNPCHPYTRALLASHSDRRSQAGTQSGTLRHRGRSSESVACSVRLSFPYTLSLCDRSVQTAGTGTGRENTGPYGGMLEKIKRVRNR